MAGRPLKFQSVDILQVQIEEYFNITPREDWAITGLALHLDTSRQTLVDYQAKDQFTDTIKKAKDKIEFGYEMRAIKRGNAFDIFALKNFDWKDKTEQELYGKDGKDLVPNPIMSVSRNNGDNQDQKPQ